MRTEEEIFHDLAALTLEPGYVHSIAQIHIRDVFVFFRAEGMRSSDLGRLYDSERLIRTELNTILGLLARRPIDFSEPPQDVCASQIYRTDTLMKELHDVMSHALWCSSLSMGGATTSVAVQEQGAAFREQIFYGGESAYSFQYRDFAADKYRADDLWLVREKGFSIDHATLIAKTMCRLMDSRATQALAEVKSGRKDSFRWLSIFEHSPEEIALATSLPLEEVRRFINAFTLSDDNAAFHSLGDYNGIIGTPLLPATGEKVLLFQHFSIYEALYDAPFYWMVRDDVYRQTAGDNRGNFAESFAASRLTKVFGKDYVFRNVQLEGRKGNSPGEIDVLVAFGDRIIIVQAKSKRLTLPARRGNDGALKKDFSEAIQKSYDQAWSCAEVILHGGCELIDSSGEAIALSRTPREIFIVCLVSDHYPALSSQARKFLNHKKSDVISAPFVMDIFLLDAMTEMLESPLRLLSYLQRRVNLSERLLLSHELAALGYHLKRNLLLDSEFDHAWLHDDVGADLEVAMTVRRDGVPGPRVPEGILTRLSGTLFESLVRQLEYRAEPVTCPQH